MDVAVWLNRLGLPQYIEPSRANEIHSGVLKKLTADDLKEIGVGPVGHRRQILAAIEELTEADLRSPEVAQEAFGPERRHLTVLFCDLVGSTRLAASMDPEDLRGDPALPCPCCRCRAVPWRLCRAVFWEMAR
jgi:hypothetical protein